MAEKRKVPHGGQAAGRPGEILDNATVMGRLLSGSRRIVDDEAVGRMRADWGAQRDLLDACGHLTWLLSSLSTAAGAYRELGDDGLAGAVDEVYGGLDEFGGRLDALLRRARDTDHSRTDGGRADKEGKAAS